jgi:type I restriction enzyme S subunit
VCSFTEIITGTTPSTKIAEYYGEPHMFITPGDIHQTKYITKTQKYLSNKGLSVSRPLPRDTVLVVCIGATIGKTAMTSIDNSVTNQQINSIITNQSIEPHYCFYAVTYYSNLLPALAGRVAIPIVNKSNFSKFLIPSPPISEQQEIARMLSSVDTKIEVEEDRNAALQALFKTMLHQLMTGKVRVKDLEVTAA